MWCMVLSRIKNNEKIAFIAYLSTFCRRMNAEKWLEDVLKRISDTKLTDLYLLILTNWKKSE